LVVWEERGSRKEFGGESKILGEYSRSGPPRGVEEPELEDEVRRFRAY